MFCKRQLITKDMLRCPNPDVPDWMNMYTLAQIVTFGNIFVIIDNIKNQPKGWFLDSPIEWAVAAVI